MSMKPMLCATGRKSDLDDPRFAAELKADGTLVVIKKENKVIQLLGKPNKKTGAVPDYTLRLPEITEAAAVLGPGSFEIVGEVVVYDENGKTWFTPCQRRCSTQNLNKIRVLKAKYPVVMLAHDLTEVDGKNIENWGYEERKAMLHDILEETRQLNIIYLPGTVENKREFYDTVVAKGEEGVVLKRLGSPYIRSRNKNWRKVKEWDKERCRVVGYTEGTGKREEFFGSLILAQPDDDGFLLYTGKVGTGFNNSELRKISNLLFDSEVKEELVEARDASKKLIPHTPVQLDLEVTVKFFEKSKNDVFRFPSMLKDDRGRNMIHYGGNLVEGEAQPKQLDLIKLLKSISG